MNSNKYFIVEDVVTHMKLSEENSNSFKNMIESLIIDEKMYMKNKLTREGLVSTIRELKTSFIKSSTNRKCTNKTETNNTVMLFLLLDRLKKTIFYENHVFEILQNEISQINKKVNNQVQTNIFQDTSDYDSDGSDNQSKSDLSSWKNKSCIYKSKRSNYSKKVITILKGWLMENLNDPYPSESEKNMLMEYTGLNTIQINNWFINARRRILPYLKNKC